MGIMTGWLQGARSGYKAMTGLSEYDIREMLRLESPLPTRHYDDVQYGPLRYVWPLGRSKCVTYRIEHTAAMVLEERGYSPDRISRMREDTKFFEIRKCFDSYREHYRRAGVGLWLSLVPRPEYEGMQASFGHTVSTQRQPAELEACTVPQPAQQGGVLDTICQGVEHTVVDVCDMARYGMCSRTCRSCKSGHGLKVRNVGIAKCLLLMVVVLSVAVITSRAEEVMRCGTPGPGTYWEVPSEIDCHAYKSSPHVKANVYQKQHVTKTVYASMCTRVQITYKTWTSLIGGKGITGMEERPAYISNDECLASHKLDPNATARTSDSGTIKYSWCCFEEVSVITRTSIVRMNLTIAGDHFISMVRGLHQCDPSQGVCRTEDSVIAWEPVSSTGSCEYQFIGVKSGKKTQAGIVFSSLHAGISNPKLTSTCMGALMCGLEGYCYTEVTSAVKGKASAKVNATGTEAAISYDLQEIGDRLDILETNLDYEFCELRNIRSRRLRRGVHTDPTGVAREMLGRHDIAAILTGEVLYIWKCSKYRVVSKHMDGAYGGQCYSHPVVEYKTGSSTRSGCLLVQQGEVVDNCTSVPCGRSMPLVYRENGTMVYYNNYHKLPMDGTLNKMGTDMSMIDAVPKDYGEVPHISVDMHYLLLPDNYGRLMMYHDWSSNGTVRMAPVSAQLLRQKLSEVGDAVEGAAEGVVSGIVGPIKRTLQVVCAVALVVLFAYLGGKLMTRRRMSRIIVWKPSAPASDIRLDSLA